MHNRAIELIETLDLVAHPEGGFYREVFRSTAEVVADAGRGTRSALTTIEFLLPAGHQSVWHIVTSDEVWHHYEGAPLELHVVDPDLRTLDRVTLGPVSSTRSPVHVVPAGHWQAARTTGDYTHAGCTVGPGFDFADFRLLRDDAETAARFRASFPETADLI